MKNHILIIIFMVTIVALLLRQCDHAKEQADARKELIQVYEDSIRQSEAREAAIQAELDSLKADRLRDSLADIAEDKAFKAQIAAQKARIQTISQEVAKYTIPEIESVISQNYPLKTDTSL